MQRNIRIAAIVLIVIGAIGSAIVVPLAVPGVFMPTAHGSVKLVTLVGIYALEIAGSIIGARWLFRA